MKKVFLVIILFVGTIICVQAQGNAPEERMGGQQMDVSQIIESRVGDLTEKLSLTSDQVSEVRAIYEKTLGEDAEPQTNSEQRHNEIMNLLNADQKEVYSDYLENRSSRSSEGMQGEMPDGYTAATERAEMDNSSMIDNRVEDLTERLSLTDDQVTEVKAIYEKTLGSQMEEGGDREALSEQRHTEIMDLLNSQQKKLYEAYLSEREQRSQERPSGRE